MRVSGKKNGKRWKKKLREINPVGIYKQGGEIGRKTRDPYSKAPSQKSEKRKELVESIINHRNRKKRNIKRREDFLRTRD